MLMPEAIGYTGEAEPVDDRGRFVQRLFLQMMRRSSRHGHRRQRRLLLLGSVAQDEAIACSEAEVPFEFRRRLALEDKVPYQIGGKPSIEDLIFLKRLRTNRRRLLWMQSSQGLTLEQDQFTFWSEKF